MTTRTETANEVRKVLQQVKDRLSQPGGVTVNEATTRAHFITPLLAALGYRSIDDILFEVYLPDGKTFLDYRLVADGKPRVSVEAKALDVNLSEQHAAQVVQYASLLGDEWAVVTNARELRVYQTFSAVPLAERLVVSANLVGWDSDSQFDSLFDQLWLLSQEAFLASGGPASWMNAKKLDVLLHGALIDPASPQVKYLRKQLEGQGMNVGAEQVASWFKARLDPVAPVAATVPAPTSYPKPTAHPMAGTVGAKELGTSTKWESSSAGGSPGFWLIPAAPQHGLSAATHLKLWLERGFWGFGEKTPGRKSIKVGDNVAFYAAKQTGVMAHARIAGELTVPVTDDEWPDPNGRADGHVVYKVPLSDITWLDPSVKVDSGMRAALDAFADKTYKDKWGFWVQTTRRLSEGDFLRLTGRG